MFGIVACIWCHLDVSTCPHLYSNRVVVDVFSSSFDDAVRDLTEMEMVHFFNDIKIGINLHVVETDG